MSGLIASFQSAMNEVAFAARKGIHGFTTADVLNALKAADSTIDLPDHVVCTDSTVVAMPSDERLRGRDFTVYVTSGNERFGMRVHDEMHVYCTDPNVLEPFVVKPKDGCPYATSRLDMAKVEALRRDGIRVSKVEMEAAVKKRKASPEHSEDAHLIQVEVNFDAETDWDSNTHVIRVRGDKFLQSLGITTGKKPVLFCIDEISRSDLPHLMFWHGIDRRHEYIGKSAAELAKVWQEHGDNEQLHEIHGKHWLTDEEVRLLSEWWQEIEWVMHGVVSLSRDDIEGITSIQHVIAFS